MKACLYAIEGESIGEYTRKSFWFVRKETTSQSLREI